MKIWLTPRFTDNPPEEVDTLEEPSDAKIVFIRNGLRITGCHWYYEGVSWHRTYEAALLAAAKHRSDRYEQAIKEAEHIRSLAPLEAA